MQSNLDKDRSKLEAVKSNIVSLHNIIATARKTDGFASTEFCTIITLDAVQSLCAAVNILLEERCEP